METSSSLISTLRQRLANPFLLSFIVSWTVYNWRIPVALFWLDANEIRVLGHLSLLNYVESQIKEPESWSVPAIFSIVMTLALPILREIYNSFNAAINRLGIWSFLKISKNSSVPTFRYLELRDEVLKQNAALEKVIKEESNFQSKYFESQEDLRVLKNAQSILNEFDNQKILQGTWELRYLSNTTKKKSIKFFGTSVEVIEELPREGHREVNQNCSITLFFRDVRPTEKIVFQIKNMDGTKVHTYSLVRTGHDSYEGLENYVDAVSFTKIS